MENGKRPIPGATARLDPDGTAKGRTTIVGRVKPGKCFGPGMPIGGLELRNNQTGERTSLGPSEEQ